MTSNTFKERFRNNIQSFTHKKYSNETELSKYVWHLKGNNTDFTMKWSIIKKVYFVYGRIKKMQFMFRGKTQYFKYLLNKRSEIVSACHNKNRFHVKHRTKKGMHAI